MAAVAEKEPEIRNTSERPSKAQLEDNIRFADAWRGAVRRGSYQGADAQAVAGLLGFLDAQHKIAMTAYEAEFQAHPEWGRPNDLPSAGGKA